MQLLGRGSVYESSWYRWFRELKALGPRFLRILAIAGTLRSGSEGIGSDWLGLQRNPIAAGHDVLGNRRGSVLSALKSSVSQRHP